MSGYRYDVERDWIRNRIRVTVSNRRGTIGHFIMAMGMDNEAEAIRVGVQQVLREAMNDYSLEAEYE